MALAQDRIFLSISFPICQGVQHPLAALAVFDCHFARLHQIVIGPNVTLPIKVGEVLIEPLPRQAGRQDGMQGVKAGVVVRQQIVVTIPVELRPG